MNFTAKEDYGLRAVLDLALQGGTAPVQTREIAARQQIPEQFLEQLLAALRRAEIVRSTRGAGGGYALAFPAPQVTVGQVLRALSGPLVPAELMGTTPHNSRANALPETLVVRGVWTALEAALREVADNTTLQDLLDRRRENSGDFGYAMHI